MRLVRRRRGFRCKPPALLSDDAAPFVERGAASAGAAMAKILVLNGPNLNLLGQREPAVYGSATLADVEALCAAAATGLGHSVECLQSNHEGVLLDTLQAAGRRVKTGELLGVVFNPGAFTHTSVALHDAIKGAEVPVIEVHISNVHAREAFRHHSYVSPAAAGLVVGFGVDGYRLAIEGLVKKSAR
jgi:3-dehydroquinate dehydratase-2